jgi:HrpA-like RNA helicase
VEIRYTSAAEPNYLDAALIAILQINVAEGPGDILTFLTGRYEIDSLSDLIESKNKLLPEVLITFYPTLLLNLKSLSWSVIFIGYFSFAVNSVAVVFLSV